MGICHGIAVPRLNHFEPSLPLGTGFHHPPYPTPAPMPQVMHVVLPHPWVRNTRASTPMPVPTRMGPPPGVLPEMGTVSWCHLCQSNPPHPHASALKLLTPRVANPLPLAPYRCTGFGQRSRDGNRQLELLQLLRQRVPDGNQKGVQQSLGDQQNKEEVVLTT